MIQQTESLPDIRSSILLDIIFYYDINIMSFNDWIEWFGINRTNDSVSSEIRMTQY